MWQTKFVALPLPARGCRWGQRLAETAYGVLAGTEEGRLGVAENEVERADGGGAPAGVVWFRVAVGHGVDSGAVEGQAGMGAGERGGGEVRGGRHDVGADEGVFHHGGVERGVVPAGPAMARRDGAVSSSQERAGAAGQIGDAQIR